MLAHYFHALGHPCKFVLRCKNLYRIGPSYVYFQINGYYGALSDIPEEYDFIDIYNATLAHKTNNNFGPYVNTRFAPMEHPRFGLIVTVTATR